MELVKESQLTLTKSSPCSGYQVTKVSDYECIIMNVYRSKSANNDFISVLNELFEFEKTMVLCGDFNFCFEEEKSHPVMKFLMKKTFTQLVGDSTHIEGRCLDHVYVYHPLDSAKKTFFSEVSCCYYSDHDRTFTSINN